MLILILSSHVLLGLPSDLASGIPTKILHAYFVPPMGAACPAHLTLLDLITLILFGEANKL